MEKISKGEATRLRILDSAVQLAREKGLEGLTIGALAERTGLSKSGLFSHFGAREELQLAAYLSNRERFVSQVIRPALAAPRGLPRLRALCQNWLSWLGEPGQAGGCLLLAATLEYDDQPGAVQDAVREGQLALRQTLSDAIAMAQANGEVTVSVSARQLAFELYGLVMVTHQEQRLLQENDAGERFWLGFERMLRK